MRVILSSFPIKRRFSPLIATVLLNFLVCHTIQAVEVVESILAIGDSITLGLKQDANRNRYDGLGTDAGNGARIGGYEPNLEQLFSAAGQTTRVYNWGIGGNSSAQGVDRMDSVLNSRSAEYVLIMFGTNDFGDGISNASTIANLRVLINKARAKGVTPILATVTYRQWRPFIPADLYPLIQQLAIDENVRLADQYAATLPPVWSTLDSGDDLHLNFAGDQVMANTWFAAITKPDTDYLPAILQLLLD